MTPTREEVIRVARECGAFLELSTTPEKDMAFLMRFAERFYEAGAAAAREPLKNSQVNAIIHSKHFHKDYELTRSDEVCLGWYRLGFRDAEQAHGIGSKT